MLKLVVFPPYTAGSQQTALVRGGVLLVFFLVRLVIEAWSFTLSYIPSF